MMLTSIKLSTFTLTLAFVLIGWVAAFPFELHKRGKNIIMGYRTVHRDQAKSYNDAGTLTYDGNRIGTQIGKGVYTTPGPGGWQGSPNDWFCVILADSEAVSRVSKAWVPKEHDDEELWFKGGARIDKYIKHLESYDDVQMAIPPGLLNSNGGDMSITAFCTESIDGIPAERINYDDWHKNIKGSRE